MPSYAGKYAICKFLQNMRNMLRSHDRYKPVSLHCVEQDVHLLTHALVTVERGVTACSMVSVEVSIAIVYGGHTLTGGVCRCQWQSNIYIVPKVEGGI